MVNDRDIIYNTFDTLVVTSETEGLSLAIIEAMAYRLAIYSTNYRAIPDMLIDNYNGEFVEQKNPLKLAEKLEEMLSGIALSAPSIDVVHNVSAMTESDLNAVKRLLVEQLYSPGRWVDCIEKLKDLGAQRLIECGPGKVLAGLTKRIDRSLACSSLGSLDSMSEVLG